MKKITTLFIILITVFLLTGCGSDGAPEGMQLVSGGSEKGYYFYAPEEWTVANTGEIDTVYVSRVDTTSVTFTKINPKSFVKADPKKSDEDFFFEDYFSLSKAEFPSDTKFGVDGESTLLGSGDTKAKKAVKYTFSYTYDKHNFGFMQIFAAHGGNFYILTYASVLEEKSEGVTSYDYYLEKLQTVIDNFTFFEAKKKESPSVEYTTDSDGDVLLTEHKLAGFDLYVPSDFSLDYSSAIVSATHSDGSNITMTKTTSGGIMINQYFELRKTELSPLVSDFKLISTDVNADFGDAKNAAAYEYTYAYNGKTFHVYQVFAIKGLSGYVFTYTATEENFSLHKDKIDRIAKKVNF